MAKTLPSAEQIKAYLDEHVIGQESAKKTLATQIYKHYLDVAIRKKKDTAGVVPEKTNILLIGPTGCGKTLLAKSLARIVDVPFTSFDATGLAQTGYVGSKPYEIIGDLLRKSFKDIKQTERGIVYIDEIDKLARGGDKADQHDVSGKGAQEDLLRFIEGTVVSVDPNDPKRSESSEGRCINIDTTNILFICGGAFEGVEEIIKRRKSTGAKIGFGSEAKSYKTMPRSALLKDLGTDDLVEFGLLRELVGRLPIVVQVEELDHGALVRILAEPQNALVKQWQLRFSELNASLAFTQDALEAIAKQAVLQKRGARGLVSILERLLEPHLYDLSGVKDDRDIRIDLAAVRGLVASEDVGTGSATTEMVEETVPPASLHKDSPAESRQRQLLEVVEEYEDVRWKALRLNVVVRKDALNGSFGLAQAIGIPSVAELEQLEKDSEGWSTIDAYTTRERALGSSVAERLMMEADEFHKNVKNNCHETCSVKESCAAQVNQLNRTAAYALCCSRLSLSYDYFAVDSGRREEARQIAKAVRQLVSVLPGPPRDEISNNLVKIENGLLAYCSSLGYELSETYCIDKPTPAIIRKRLELLIKRLYQLARRDRNRLDSLYKKITASLDAPKKPRSIFDDVVDFMSLPHWLGVYAHLLGSLVGVLSNCDEAGGLVTPTVRQWIEGG